MWSKEGRVRLIEKASTKTKRILITGANSYIGNAFTQYATSMRPAYQIEKLSLRNIDWDQVDLQGVDAILHCAGIAHNATKTSDTEQYFAVNQGLTDRMARLARQAGVPHFIYMSSMIVYGNTSRSGEINLDTPLTPENAYGQSKLAGEEALNKLAGDDFKVTIIRAPMVYGLHSKGNYPLLAKFSRLSPIFPEYDNQRSMIYIENLAELICQVIDQQIEGIIHPQNQDYVSTANLVHEIAKQHDKKIYLTPIFNGLIRLMIKYPLIQKVFGDRYYSKDLSAWPYDSYQVCSFEESIRRTEQQ